MSVAFISGDFTIGTDGQMRPGGCGYYRCILPMLVCGQRAQAGRQAWDPLMGFGIKEAQDTGIFGFNNVMLKLMMLRWTPKQISLAQNLGQRVYCDIDDFYKGLTPANRAYEETHADTSKIQNRDHYEKVIDAVDVLTVSTPFLLDYYQQQRDNVVMVRNGVNMHQFTPVTQNRKPVIGWTGHIGYRNNDLEQLQEWLPDFLEENDLYFHHAGYDPTAPSFADVTGINPDRLTTSPMLPIDQYANSFKFDLGIVPLSDIPFNHAKSNIKGLEYISAGIPFVASDLPEYRLLHEDGVGILAATTFDWQQQMNTLLDYQYRLQAIRQQRQIVVSKWSIEARAAEWQAVFSPDNSLQ
jgi:hypothetical protein